MQTVLNQLKTQLMPAQLINAGLETLLNYLIKNTAHTENYFYKLNGKILALHLQRFDFPIYFVFSQDRIEVLHDYQGEVDARVSLARNMPFTIPQKSQLSQLINNQQLSLEGDLQVVQDFTALLEFLEKDPAEILSRYLGDVPAHMLVESVRELRQCLINKGTQSQKYWGERLTEEWCLLAPSLAVIDFCQQVEELATKTAELEQKLSQFLPNLNKAGGASS